MIFIFDKSSQKMGVKDLASFIRTKFPQAIEIIHLSEYAYKRVAIRKLFCRCTYKRAYAGASHIYGPNGWLNAFIKLVAVLRENEIHCVFIYDSTAGREKDAEKKRRAESKQKQEQRIYDLELAIDQYHQTGQVDPILLELSQKRKIEKPLLARRNGDAINIIAIESILEKLKAQVVPIQKEDFLETKKVFDMLDVPYFQASKEAETTCADLCKQGKVDAVLSEDTDILAYGAPVFLSKFDPKSSTCSRICYDKLLEAMELTDSEFLDFCILCGLDYNDRISGIGPVKAYNLIKQHKTIDRLPELKLDITPLKHEMARSLFRDYEKCNHKIPYCGAPDFDKLQNWVVEKNLRLNLETLRASFVREIILEI
jgi:5'-3' exonuclease